MNIQYKKAAVLGGDRRQASLAASLQGAGLDTAVWGLPAKILSPTLTQKQSWQECLLEADLVVLPLPASPDSMYLNLPLMEMGDAKPPRILDIVKGMKSGAVLAGGRFSPTLKALPELARVQFFDYFDSELLQEKNALPTAEGALLVLMQEVPRTVMGLSVAVTGFGRISKALVKLLLGMGAKVTVAARKPSNLESAAALGCSTVHIDGKEGLEGLATGFDVIFNTVPYRLFDSKLLAKMEKGTLLIDLASAPGGVDAAAARGEGIQVIFALSLPGKYAPVTAGELLAETILNYMEETP